MALNKPVLVNEIVKVLKKVERNTTNRDKAQLDLAKGLANAIENYVKSGTVSTVIEGIVSTNVRTTGTSTAQTGTGNGKITTGTGTGKII